MEPPKPPPPTAAASGSPERLAAGQPTPAAIIALEALRSALAEQAATLEREQQALDERLSVLVA